MAKKAKRGMVVLLLDSNTIIYLSKGIVDIDDILLENESYAISVVTYMEVLGYHFKSSQEELIMRDLLSLFDIIYIDNTISEMVIKIRKNNKIKLPDAIICATAIVNNLILFSSDIRLKVIKDLQLNLIGVYLGE